MSLSPLPLAILIAIMTTGVVRADTDAIVSEAIFGGQHVAESSVAICSEASELPIQQRLDRLSDWILPSDNHRDFRITLDFVANPHNDHGAIVSPVLDWLQAAGELGIIDQLTSRVESVKTNDESMQTKKIAIQLLLAMQSKDVQRAAPLAQAFFQRVFSDENSLVIHRDAILLCLHQSNSSDDLASLVIGPAQQLPKRFEAEEAVTAWHQHLKAITAVIQNRVLAKHDATTSPSNTSPSMHSQWHPVARSRAWEHGSGFPGAQWRFGKNRATNQSSHGEDFLFFSVPLQGDYDVDSDVSSFDWKDTQIMTSGTWMELHYERGQARIGNAQGRQDFVSINSPLTDMQGHSTFHYRASIRKETITGYFNGRRSHEQALGVVTNPWVAVRSSPHHDGDAVDLRITGGTVPKTLSLSDVRGLPGWFEHYQSPDLDGLVDWQQRPASNSTTSDGSLEVSSFEISGPRDSRLPQGCNNERLLRYLRPMLEDGTIEYQFWYQPGEFLTHPALGRSCFLLEPDRVVVHSLTDGKFDRTSARADGGTVIESVPPLKPAAWNTVTLQLAGDELQLHLNGTLLHTHTVASTASRQFGLFHYNDQTAARVRNVKWTGNWPDSLPSLAQQSLAVVDPVLAASNLAETGQRATRKLNSESLTSPQFNVYSGSLKDHFKGAQDGITITRPSANGYCDARMSPNMDITGDFDITVDFDSLKAHSIQGSLACLTLEIGAIESFEHQTAIRVRVDSDGSHVVQCTSVKLIDGERRGEYFGAQPFDADAGRLRLSRRGGEMIYLIAENDSEQFRIIGRREVTTAALGHNSIRFGAQMIAEDGVIGARWTSLEVVADQLDGLALANYDGKLEELNAAFAKSPPGSRVDLTEQPPMVSDFMRWGDLRPWNASDGGLMIQHVGTDHWDGSGMLCRHYLIEDFDITIELDSIDLAAPKSGQQTRVFLQFETTGSASSQANVILNRSPGGGIELQTQTRIADAQGNPIYADVTHSDGQGIQRLRLVRVGKMLYYLAGTDTPETDKVLFHTDLEGSAGNSGFIRAIVHTGGQGRTSQVRIKSWDIRCEKIPKLNQPPPATSGKSILRSLFDLF